MSNPTNPIAVEWTDAEREAVSRAVVMTRWGTTSVRVDAVLAALARFVAERERVAEVLGRPHAVRTTTQENTMPSEVIVTDDMRRPDERVRVHPFRHPWIKGTDTDPECGRTWHDHGWIDRGDHGFTVCPTEAERPEVTAREGRPASAVEWTAAEREAVRAAVDESTAALGFGYMESPAVQAATNAALDALARFVAERERQAAVGGAVDALRGAADMLEPLSGAALPTSPHRAEVAQFLRDRAERDIQAHP